MQLATRCKLNGCEVFAFLNTLTDTNDTDFSHVQSAMMNLDVLEVRCKQLMQLVVSNRECRNSF